MPDGAVVREGDGHNVGVASSKGADSVPLQANGRLPTSKLGIVFRDRERGRRVVENGGDRTHEPGWAASCWGEGQGAAAGACGSEGEVAGPVVCGVAVPGVPDSAPAVDCVAKAVLVCPAAAGEGELDFGHSHATSKTNPSAAATVADSKIGSGSARAAPVCTTTTDTSSDPRVARPEQATVLPPERDPTLSPGQPQLPRR